MKFDEINLPKGILNSLTELKYNDLTPIQEKIIPEIQKGRDVLACSPTGSGKTGAFLIPMLSQLIEDKEKKSIIISPTRELAIQIMDNAKSILNKDKSINIALLIGGKSVNDQLLSIQKKARLIIGTPGRINDFLDSRRLNISDFSILILDEMDRMLDMGFSSQIDNITRRIRQERQTMLFSATISKNIEATAQKYLKNPVVIKVGNTNQASINVSQEIIKIENDKKFDALLQKLKGNTIFTIVFVKTKFGTEKLANKLIKENIMAKAIHGDLKQNKRTKIIQDFRNKTFNVLVATDVAARGLDIHHIDTIVNYDLPRSPEDYIHRIGRCSRTLNSKGCSISFCNKEDEKFLKAINSFMKNGEYSDDLGFENKNKPNKSRKSRTNERSKTSRNQSNTRRDPEKKHSNNNVQNKNNVNGYDIEGLMNNKIRKIKKATAYSITKTTTEERRKKLGLNE